MPISSAKSAGLIVILLGASEWPKSKFRWPGSKNFRNSAESFKQYLLDPQALSLDSGSVLDLFDDDRPQSKVDESIERFLIDHSERMTDVLVYYTGHGAFTDDDRKYCLALRDTNADKSGASAYRMSSLASTLRKSARHARKYLIIDACYAAAALHDFIPQSDNASRMEDHVMSALPKAGTALLCAASAVDVALSPTNSEYTMFTEALLDALRNGSQRVSGLLSFDDLRDHARDFIREKFLAQGVQPELYIPDQRCGEISSVGLFPNPAQQALVSTVEIHALPVAATQPPGMPQGRVVEPARSLVADREESEPERDHSDAVKDWETLEAKPPRRHWRLWLSMPFALLLVAGLVIGSNVPLWESKTDLPSIGKWRLSKIVRNRLFATTAVKCSAKLGEWKTIPPYVAEQPTSPNAVEIEYQIVTKTWYPQLTVVLKNPLFSDSASQSQYDIYYIADGKKQLIEAESQFHDRMIIYAGARLSNLLSSIMRANALYASYKADGGQRLNETIDITGFGEAASKVRSECPGL